MKTSLKIKSNLSVSVYTKHVIKKLILIVIINVIITPIAAAHVDFADFVDHLRSWL